MVHFGLMASLQHAKVAYEFLQERAKSGAAFTAKQLANAAGWSLSSATTYIGKQYRDFLLQAGSGYIVQPAFKRMSWEEFQQLITQKRKVYTEYQRRKHDSFVTFEFLLPLTREDRLRRTLDDLFFADTVRRRLEEIGLEQMEKVVPRVAGESNQDYLARILALVADYFGGYSISHVAGRFRAHPSLLDRKEVGDLMSRDERYLIDETTASVRFIAPCKCTRTSYGKQFDEIINAVTMFPLPPTIPEDVAEELNLIRQLFFQLFVEAIVKFVKGEDQIWLMEVGPQYSRLYVWEAQ
jgi:hypothetical protein